MQKHSKKREAVFECICSTKSHPSAEWVYSQLKPQMPDLSLATVYRNMAMFKDQGSIVTIATVDGHERVDGNTAPHPHFICSECSAVIDIDPFDAESELDSIVENKYGISVDSHSLLFRGQCRQCKEKNNKIQ